MIFTYLKMAYLCYTTRLRIITRYIYAIFVCRCIKRDKASVKWDEYSKSGTVPPKSGRLTPMQCYPQGVKASGCGSPCPRFTHCAVHLAHCTVHLDARLLNYRFRTCASNTKRVPSSYMKIEAIPVGYSAIRISVLGL